MTKQMDLSGDRLARRQVGAVWSGAALLCSAVLAIGCASSAAADPAPNATGPNDYFHTGAGARYLVRAKAPIETIPLRGNLNVLMGSGGNITVLSGPEGKFLVDAGISPSKDRIRAALNAISPAPVKYVVNTHWHWDHTDGNEWVHSDGATIIAHRNTRKYLTETTHVDDWNWTFPPVREGARPTIIVDDEKDLALDGEVIKIKHVGPGHTDGDLWVYFEKADVLSLGDTFWNGNYPFIDNQDGGGINSAIAWANKAIEQATDRTILIPGHGPIGRRENLIEFRDMLVAVRDNIAALKAQGKTLDEVIAAKPTAAFDAKWGKFVITPSFFTKLVYDGL